jgi:hypothetical protein
MNKLLLVIVLLNCLALTAPVFAQEVKQKKTEKQSNSISQQSVKKIPVEIPLYNQIYVQARINNSEPMWFLLDTASTWSILDVDKAKELNIKSEGNQTLDLGQINTVTTTFAKNAMLDISGVKIPVKELAVMPTKFRHAPQVVGLIGSELFKRFVVEIDYQARTINLFEPKTYKYTGRGEIIPVEIVGEIPHIEVSISKGSVNSVKTKLSLDTGASQTAMLYAPFVEKNRLLETTEGTIKLAAGGLGGGNTVHRVRAKSVRVGNTIFDNPLIYFSTGKGSSTEWKGGVLGNGFLNRFKVILDHSRKQVILERAEKMSVPTDFDVFYFDIVREENLFKIGDVLQSATAGAAGLKKGDVLLAVDGKSVSNLSLVKIKQMFVWDGREIVLSVKRAEETLEIKLKTSKIL